MLRKCCSCTADAVVGGSVAVAIATIAVSVSAVIVISAQLLLLLLLSSLLACARVPVAVVAAVGRSETRR